MKCQRCKGTKKLYQISAKCSDLYSEQHLNGGKSYDGYVPEWIGGYGTSASDGRRKVEPSGDYVEFTICRHCGQVQGEWPELDKKANQFKYGKAS